MKSNKSTFTNYNNFQQAYTPNTTLINPQKFDNKNELLHNNVESNLLNELYIDYTVHVDSGDRDIVAYPNPYNFVLNFGGSGPQPIIDKKFRNVKTVNIDKIFFPKYIGYDLSGTEYVGSVTLASRYRYIIVRIKELDNNRMYSTNNYVRDDSFVMYNDKTLGDQNTSIWTALSGERMYQKSALKNINKFTIDIVDPKGDSIFPTWNNNGIHEKISYTELTNVLTRDQYEFQIHFIFSILENELNTKPNFR